MTDMDLPCPSLSKNTDVPLKGKHVFPLQAYCTVIIRLRIQKFLEAD